MIKIIAFILFAVATTTGSNQLCFLNNSKTECTFPCLDIINSKPEKTRLRTMQNGTWQDAYVARVLCGAIRDSYSDNQTKFLPILYAVPNKMSMSQPSVEIVRVIGKNCCGHIVVFRSPLRAFDQSLIKRKLGVTTKYALPFVWHCGESQFYSNIESGAFAHVLNNDIKRYSKCIAVWHVDELTRRTGCNVQPRPSLVAHDLVSFLRSFDGIEGRANLSAPNLRLVGGHFLSSSEGEEDKNNRPASDNESDDRSPAHDFSKKSHLLLSTKVLIGAIMVAGGYYLLINTVPHGYRLKREAFLINAIFGILYVVFGALFVSIRRRPRRGQRAR